MDFQDVPSWQAGWGSEQPGTVGGVPAMALMFFPARAFHDAWEPFLMVPSWLQVPVLMFLFSPPAVVSSSGGAGYSSSSALLGAGMGGGLSLGAGMGSGALGFSSGGSSKSYTITTTSSSRRSVRK